jgi:hypothetical protein
MQRVLLAFALLFLPCPMMLGAQPSSYPRTMYITYDHTPVYDSASYMSLLVGDLQVGDSVQVLGVSNKFYRIGMGTREGYVLWSNISPDHSSGASTKDGKKQSGTHRKRAALPPDSSGIVSSDGAAGNVKRTEGQCRAVTKSGKQCSRMAADSSGYCWQHRK